MEALKCGMPREKKHIVWAHFFQLVARSTTSINKYRVHPLSPKIALAKQLRTT